MTAPRIAVLRALPGLGDILCATPALRALRAARPEAQIDVIALERTRALWERVGAHVVAFPGFEGLPEEPYDPARTDAFFAQAPEYDLAFQLHGSGPQSTAFVERLGAERTYAPSPWREDRHEALWQLDVLAQAGIPAAGTELDWPAPPGGLVDLAFPEELNSTSLSGGQTYAVLHAGSSLPDRRWPADRFAAVAAALHEQGLAVVLTGTPAEAEAVAAVKTHLTVPAVDLVGRTDLDALAALLARARVVVVNDTGVSHLAAAVRAPSVVLFTVTDPARWGPLDHERHRPLVRPRVEEVVSAAAAAARSPGSGP